MYWGKAGGLEVERVRAWREALFLTVCGAGVGKSCKFYSTVQVQADMASPPPPPPSKLHFLLVPLPEQGHVNPMLCFASHLAALGCTVTFVKAEKAPLATAQALVPEPKLETACACVKTDTLAGQHALRAACHAPLCAKATLNATYIPPISTETTLNGTQTPPHQHTLLQEFDHDDGSASPNGKVTPLASNGMNIRFWTLPHVGGLAPLTEASSRFEILKHTLGSLEERQGIVENLVEESKASNAPISCIICDILLCSWVMNLAKRQAIMAATLVPCSGVNFYLPYVMKLGKREESEKLRQRFGLPEMKMPTNPEEIKRMAELRSVFGKAHDGVEKASHVLVNSFEHLELALLDSLKASDLNVKFIGPCLPAWEARDAIGEVDKIMAKQAGCIFTPDHACLAWLDKQEKGSVLFLSFGSEVNLEEEQMQELALGIEGSGHKFLWVVRPDAPSHNLPQEDFRKRTSDIGMFVSWAPQRKVLQHTAVGGFLTHCGWNSTLESMMFGVPMLCFPLNGDQFLNAQLISAHWKVGLRLGPPRTLVVRAEVERAVRDLMKGNDLRERIAQLKEAAHCAILDSQISITSFVQDIAKKSYQKLSD